jgi:xylulokinase
MGLIRQGILGLTVGTAGIAAMGLDAFKHNDGGRLQVFCNNAPDLWHVMGVTITAGGALQWYKNQFCQDEIAQAKKDGKDVYSIIDDRAAESPPGSKNLIFLPYLNGERCPYADPFAKAAFIGLTLQHDKRDMNRAVLEGVQYSLRQIYDLISLLDDTIKVSEIIISGGGSRSAIWRQICADVFQAPVKTVSGSAEGAAMLAGVGCGIWKNLGEAVSCLRVETITEPNTLTKSVYDHLLGVYRSLYPALTDAFKQLSS